MTPRDIAESLVHWPEEDLPQGIVFEDCAFLVANAYLALEQKLAIAKEALERIDGLDDKFRLEHAQWRARVALAELGE